MLFLGGHLYTLDLGMIGRLSRLTQKPIKGSLVGEFLSVSLMDLG